MVAAARVRQHAKGMFNCAGLRSCFPPDAVIAIAEHLVGQEDFFGDAGYVQQMAFSERVSAEAVAD